MCIPLQVLPIVKAADCAIDRVRWGPGESLIHCRTERSQVVLTEAPPTRRTLWVGRHAGCSWLTSSTIFLSIFVRPMVWGAVGKRFPRGRTDTTVGVDVAGLQPWKQASDTFQHTTSRSRPPRAQVACWPSPGHTKLDLEECLHLGPEALQRQTTQQSRFLTHAPSRRVFSSRLRLSLHSRVPGPLSSARFLSGSHPPTRDPKQHSDNLGPPSKP